MVGVGPPALKRLEPEHCGPYVVGWVDHIILLIGVKFFQLSSWGFERYEDKRESVEAP